MLIAPKLKPGNGVRIVAPSCTLPSMPWMTDELFNRGKQWFIDRGMVVTEAKHLREIDDAGSTTIEHRLEDLHAAFADPDVHCVLCIRGGWNANQLLPFLDYDLMKRNPKIFCGFSDITALSNAIYAKTGLVNYSGPNGSQFSYGEKLGYTYDYFEAAVMQDKPIVVHPSKVWTDSYFSPDSEWAFTKNLGWWVLGEGKAEGVCIGGNLCTLSLLQGTEFMPRVDGKTILLVEDDHETHPRTFDRDLTSLTQQPWFNDVIGVLFGRFQTTAVNKDFGPVTKERLKQIVSRNTKLSALPMIANVDFGHTYPSITLPIGGTLRMNASSKTASIEILAH